MFNDKNVSKRKNFAQNTGFDRKPVHSSKDRRYVVKYVRTTDEVGSIVLKFTVQLLVAASEG